MQAQQAGVECVSSQACACSVLWILQGVRDVCSVLLRSSQPISIVLHARRVLIDFDRSGQLA